MLPALKSNRKDGFSMMDDDFFTPVFNTLFESVYKQDKDGNTILEIEVPGFNKDNISVEIAEGILTVEGENKTKKLYKKYTIGNIQDVNASIKDGILSLTLVESKKQVRKISLR